MVYLEFMIIFFASITCSVHSQQIKVIKSLEEIVESVPRSIQPKRLSDKDIHEMFLNVSSSLDKDQAELPMSIHKLSSIGIGVARQIYQMGIQPYELYNAPVEFCPYAEKPECDHNYQYRSYDGSCNNEKYPWYGMKNTPFRRLLKPAYHDNINEPRLRSTTGRLLSNPRKIAMDVHNPLDEYSDKFSSLLPHYAQFVAHDMSLIQLINEKSEKSDKPIKCYCYIDNSNCIKINMPKSDKINEDQECMSTPRSSASFKSFNCDLGAREQLNSKSHYLDLSQVYGTDTTEISNLRQFNGGLLKSATFNGNKKFQYLPFDKEGDCDEIKKDMNCLRAGDRRLLQNLHLASMHTIWMRMHNMMAKNLKELNPSWDDEKLFQESRKMCSAMYQHTIYNEYLPVLLSSKVAEMYEIHSETVGYSSKYDPKVYPSVLNEAITAALRFGHSMVRSEYTHVDSKYREHGELPISAIVFNTEKAFDNHTSIDTFIRSSVYNRAGKYDTHINDFLTNHLFENPKSERNKRVSLPALNIMRGRDHGLQPYHQYRQLCGLNKAKDFDDLYNIPKEARDNLRSAYENVDDIDLFTGGIAERPIEGGAVGATFTCIIAKQFKDLKHGDRFFYEYPDARFTNDQLTEIKKVSMWQILCLTLDVESVQKNPFLLQNHHSNPHFYCDTKKKNFNYTYWKENY